MMMKRMMKRMNNRIKNPQEKCKELIWKLNNLFLMKEMSVYPPPDYSQPYMQPIWDPNLGRYVYPQQYPQYPQYPGQYPGQSIYTVPQYPPGF